MPNLKKLAKSKFFLTPIFILLTLTILNKVIFAMIVPIWHTPDEQAHFAQVAYFAEFNEMPKKAPDLNKEILESEILLGTSRDNRGNNKFTFHPEYKIEYTNNLTGKYEEEIRNFPKEYRKQLVAQEAAYYPPLYYWLSAIPYKLFYNLSLIDRVYLSRFISILISALTVYFCYLISKLVFPQNRIKQLTLTTLVSFHPMFSFVSSGVTSDNLLNLLFTIFLFLSLLLIKNGFNKKVIAYLLLNFFLLYLTKPQLILAIPILTTSIIFYLFSSSRINKNYKYILSILLIFALSIFTFLISSGLTDDIMRLIPFFMTYYPVNEGQSVVGFLQFFKETLLHTIREVIPWYWGVFDWLGVTYPIEIIRILNRIMIISGIGILIFYFKVFKSKVNVIKDTNVVMVTFLAVSALIYFIGITYYNYLFTLGHGFPFGIQGRYFFPTIISHMAIILIGLISLIPSRFTNISCKILTLSIISLNFIALWIISKTYFDLSNINTFVIQASQYKPDLFKGYWIIFFLFIYIILLTMFLFNYLRLKNIQTKST